MVSAMLVSMVMGHVPVKQDIKADTVMKVSDSLASTKDHIQARNIIKILV